MCGPLKRLYWKLSFIWLHSMRVSWSPYKPSHLRRQKRPELWNCASHYQSTANLLTHPSIQRVSDELIIWQSFRHLHDFDKSCRSSWIVPHVTKFLKNFWLTLVFGEYQASSSSDSLFSFVTFTTSIKASGAVELCLTLPNFWKTFDSP